MMPAYCAHDPDSRFLQRRYRCEWCDRQVSPEKILWGNA